MLALLIETKCACTSRMQEQLAACKTLGIPSKHAWTAWRAVQFDPDYGLWMNMLGLVGGAPWGQAPRVPIHRRRTLAESS